MLSSSSSPSATPPQPAFSSTPSSLCSALWTIRTWPLCLDRQCTPWPSHPLQPRNPACTPRTCCTPAHALLLLLFLFLFLQSRAPKGLAWPFGISTQFWWGDWLTHPFLCHLCILLVLLLLLCHSVPPPLIELRCAEVVRVIVVLLEFGLQPVLDVGDIRHDGGKVLRDLAGLDGFYIGRISLDFSDSAFLLCILFLANGLQGFRPKRGILSYPSFLQVQLWSSGPTLVCYPSGLSDLGYVFTSVFLHLLSSF